MVLQTKTILSYLLNFFFTTAPCAGGLTKEKIELDGQARKCNFIELLEIDSRKTVCVHVYYHGFYKCFFVDAENAADSAYYSLLWFSCFSVPAVALRIVCLHLPVKIQGQIYIQALITHRQLAIGSTGIGLVYYGWKMLSNHHPDIVSEGSNNYGNEEQEAAAFDKMCNESVEETQNDLQQNEHNESSLLYFCEKDQTPLPDLRIKAVEQLIHELTGLKSSLSTRQLKILKDITFNGKPILTDAQEKEILFQQTGLADNLNSTDESDNLFSELLSQAPKLEVTNPGSLEHSVSLEKAKQALTDLLGKSSGQVKLNGIAPLINQTSNLQEKISNFYNDPPSPSGQAVKPFTELQALEDELENTIKDQSLYIYSIDEPKSDFGWLHNLIDSWDSYSTLIAIGFFLVLTPFLRSLYNQAYLILTYLLPQLKEKNPDFFLRYKKLNAFLSKLPKDAKHLDNLRLILTISSFFYGIFSLTLIIYIFKKIIELLKNLN